MKNIPMPRLDRNEELRSHILKYCRLQRGEVGRDPLGKHRVACMDDASLPEVDLLMGGETAALAIQDPPYNLVAFDQRDLSQYINWCSEWIRATDAALAPNSALYIWLGAD